MFKEVKELDPPASKWRWMVKDPKLIVNQLMHHSCTPEAAQNQIILVQHHMATASYNLLQELIGTDPLETEEIPMLAELTDIRAGFLATELEEMVKRLKLRHLWSVLECGKLNLLTTHLHNFTEQFTELTPAKKNTLIGLQQDFLKLVYASLQQEDRIL